MPESLSKLQPNRDLLCYFQRPSAIAALSSTSTSGFTVSGSWRQQFDWAVIEWNRDNTFEHPLLRNLPDGDLSGLQLSYQETRSNCISMDSTLYPTVDWPSLRIWADPGTGEVIYKVPLRSNATSVAGATIAASATFGINGTPTPGDYIELAWETEHYTYQLTAADTLASSVAAVANSVNTFSTTMSAAVNSNQITLTYRGNLGANGNRLGVYGNVSGSRSESWSPVSQNLSGGISPSAWQVNLNFSTLTDVTGVKIPANAIRKMRWTYAADLQPGSYVRSEFSVVVSNWTVNGTGRGYQVAGPGSRRIEDSAREVSYTGAWSFSKGNFSGGSIGFTTTPGDRLSTVYTSSGSHQLYLGTRRSYNASLATFSVDGATPKTIQLLIPGEDVLSRVLLGTFSGGPPHTVVVTHAGNSGEYLYFDFLEVVYPSVTLPTFPVQSTTTLATDWDTDHSIALPPERTAWLIHTLGFQGRANHYAGALWFYELVRIGHVYASGTVTFNGTPTYSGITQISIGVLGSGVSPTVIQHLHLVGDTAVSISKAFELMLNNGYTAVWAHASGTTVTIYSRSMGTAGNSITLAASTMNSPSFNPQASGPTLAGGVDGTGGGVLNDIANIGWRTDLAATPRINRAARDWTRGFFTALNAYGITGASAFSTELQHGDPSVQVGIAQRYPSGNPVLLNTPALQTNFSPASLAYWQQVHLDMATVLVAAGQTPYLQFGEVQWWYFPDDGSGMPFYDAYTQQQFATQYGRPMTVFTNANASPAAYPQEAAFLPALIGQFTTTIMAFVRQTYPQTKFEVLYPPDVNNYPFTSVVNLPLSAWSPATLDCLKTENFSYTAARNLNQSKISVLLPITLGFPRSKSSHLVGISDYTTPWQKEAGQSLGENVESVVLFALDQFCLIGYSVPYNPGVRRGLFLS